MSLCKNFSRKCARLAAFCSLVAASAVAAQAQVVFSPPKNISNSSGNTQAQQVAVDKNGNIDVVWLDNSPGSYAVFFSRSADAGLTFSTPVNVSNHPGKIAFNSSIAVDSGGNIYIVWDERGNISFADNASFFSRSTDGGATFSTPQLISSPGASGGGSQIVVDSSGNINIGWSDNSPGHFDAFFARSTDGGTTFSSPLNLSNSNNPIAIVSGLTLATDLQGGIYALWSEDRTLSGPMPVAVFSDSLDGGATFSTPKLITSSVVNTFPDDLQIGSNSPNEINIVVETNSENDCVSFDWGYSRSTNGGSTFAGVFGRVTSNNCPNQTTMRPRMKMDLLGGTNVVWQESTPGSTSGTVMFGRWVNGSGSPGPVSSVQGNNSLTPELALDPSNNIDIVFAGGTSPALSILFTQSTDSGVTFSPAQPVSIVGAVTNPTITAGAGGNAYVAWEQANSSGNADVFFSRGIALSLSSLGLSATSATGGSSATGTVTLNAAAPAGGAVISLSSSNPSVSVPASVTIAEGATSATFSVTTSPVAATTTSVVSAALGGVTQTASITVQPPVLTSVTLNPSSTMGGSSSTGTVTLNGPAPAGGSVVALSNSNASVASVPSSVAVTAGSTNVTFTVNTTRQLCPKSATITASFSGVTLTSNLAVQPFVTLPSQACSAIGAHGGGPGQ